MVLCTAKKALKEHAVIYSSFNIFLECFNLFAFKNWKPVDSKTRTILTQYHLTKN